MSLCGFFLLVSVRKCGEMSRRVTSEPSRWLRNHHCQWHLLGTVESCALAFLQSESIQAGIEVENAEQVTADLHSSSADSSATRSIIKLIRRHEGTVSNFQVLFGFVGDLRYSCRDVEVFIASCCWKFPEWEKGGVTIENSQRHNRRVENFWKENCTLLGSNATFSSSRN